MTMKNKIDRREFLKASLTAGGALLVSFSVPHRSRAAERLATAAESGDFQPNAFIRIGRDGGVAITIGQAEMGQGVITSLAMIIADELEVEWSKISYGLAPAGKDFINPLFGTQGTGGSTSIKAFYGPLRKSAAAVRAMLVTAGAANLGVAVDSCRAELGKVVDPASGRSVAYTEILEAASRVPAPADPKLKDPKDFRYIGKAVKRIDSPEKVNGKAVFGIDVRLPGMLYATVQRSPVIGGKVRSLDDTAAKAVKGVTHVVRLESGIAVVAENFYAARRGRLALKVVWDEGKMAAVSSDAIYKSFKEAADTEKGMQVKTAGDVNASRTKATKTVEAVYWAPYLAHATMEPMNYTADVRADSAELWGGSQVQMVVQAQVAKALELPVEKVKINSTLLGGGFGRRVGTDYVLDSALLSKATGKPVKVIWTREDDIQNDFHRPATYNKMSAGLDPNGNPVFWHHRIVNPSIMANISQTVFGFPFPAGAPDDSSFEGAHNIPYKFPNLQVDWIRKDPGVPVGFWRSVGSSHTAFSVECFLDELAAAAGKDPLEFRLSLLDPTSRHAGVLKLAAEKAGWSSRSVAGTGRGIAVAESFGSFVAQVAEVSVGKDGSVKVNRVVCAVDCGQTVNPDTVAAQMEGSIIFGLTAALYGEITVRNGRIEQGNFNNYKMLRMNESPRIEVHILPSRAPHGGVGEPGTPPIAPAVINAIFAATGKRVRTLPVRAADITGKS
jgi:isoquinoline 1-oxidoreductase beta subunit